MLEISVVNAGEARRGERRVAGVARGSVVRPPVHGGLAAKLALAAAVLLGHLGHVPLESRKLVRGRHGLHRVRLGPGHGPRGGFLDRGRVHGRVGGHRHLATVVVDVLDLFLL